MTVAKAEYVAPDAPLLIVEDNATLRRVLVIAMRHAGFEVHEAETGAAALEILEEGDIAGVLLDMGLPDNRSGEVLEWLHAHGERPPWLVISAMDPAEVARIDRSIGTRLVSKPFDPWLLIDRVKAMTAQEEEKK